MFNYCKEHLTISKKMIQHNNALRYLSKREFVYVSKNEVNHSHIPGIKTVVGTRQLHSVIGTGNELTIKVRKLSCFCAACALGTLPCENSSYVDSWEIKQLSLQEIIPCSSAKHSTQDECDIRNTDTKFNQLPTAQTNPDTTQYEHNTCDISGRQSEFSEGKFILVKVAGKKRTISFPAEILDLEAEKFKVKFMKEIRKNVFTWPEIEDTSWIARDEIIKILPMPRPINTRMQFSFE